MPFTPTNPWEAPQLVEIDGEPVPINSIPKSSDDLPELPDVIAIPEDAVIKTLESNRETPGNPLSIEIDGWVNVRDSKLIWKKTDGSVCLSYQSRLTDLGVSEGLMWLFATHVFSSEGVPLNYDGVDALGLEGAKKLQNYVVKRNNEHKAVNLDDNTLKVGDRVFKLDKYNSKLSTVSGFLNFQSNFNKNPLKFLEQSLTTMFDAQPKQMTFWEVQSLINFLFNSLVSDSEADAE